MSPRYLLLIGAEGNPPDDLHREFSARTGLDVAFSNGAIAAFVNEGCACIPIGRRGCILGYLFPRHGPARQTLELTEAQAARIAANQGQSLMEDFWGGYVAVINGAGRASAMRDPAGNFPCYFSEYGECLLIASDAELLVAAMGSNPGIDHHEIGRQLYRAFVPAPGTAISGVRELLAGFRLWLPSLRQEPCWSPWDHADPARMKPEAHEQLARTVQHCVGAWSSTQSSILLSVSGGLDSSIVAACLARARSRAMCLTMYTDEPSGDERAFARLLCDRIGLPLVERPYQLEHIDLDAPLAAHLPRPKDRTQAVAYERVHDAVAAEVGADAFMTGNGGDHVFGYSQSATPIADLYLAHGFGSSMLRSLKDVCRQTGCSMAQAARQAWATARGPRGYRVRPASTFLASDLLASIPASELEHPWLDAPPDASPGKAAHIAAILRVQPALEAEDVRRAVLNPLVSQPIIEACLAVPSWEWRAGGRDRSLARRAFASQLPPAIANRRTKGSPGRFAALLLDHFRAGIRERLLDGELASNHIVDKLAIEQTLAGDRPVPDLQRVRLLELVNAEAWIRAWRSRSGSAPPLDRRAGDHAVGHRRGARPRP